MAKESCFIFNIPSFVDAKAKAEGGEITSSFLPLYGYDWGVRLCSDGSSSSKGTHLSVWLCCRGPTDVRRPGEKWVSPKVRATFSVIRKKRRHFVMRFEKSRCLSATSDSTGYNEWIPLEMLEGADSLLNDDGSLDVDVCIEKTCCDAGGGLSASKRYMPSMIPILDAPKASYADVSLSGVDKKAPILAHRAVLGYRVDYFRKLFDSPGSSWVAPQRFLRSSRDAEIAVGTLRIADLTTEALSILIRRIYGEQFPEYLSEHKHIGILLDLWHFSTVGLMDGLPEECSDLVKYAVTSSSFASCYHMAVLLDDFEMRMFLAEKIESADFDTVSKDIVETFTSEDMQSLLSLAPPGLKALVLADLWVKQEKGRACFGEALFRSFQADTLPASQYDDFGALDIVVKYAPRDVLLDLLRSC